MKKLISILLVMVMMVCIFTIPAAASEIEPRYVVVSCEKCNGAAQLDKVLFSQDIEWVTSCKYANYLHYHDLYISNVYVDCPNCGYYYSYTAYDSVCA